MTPETEDRSQKIFLFSVLCSLFSVICSSIALAEEEKFTYNSHGKRDPFFPIVSEEGNFLASPGYSQVSETGENVLEGIVWDAKGDSIAIIDKQVVYKGDWVGSYQVIEIKPDRVVVGDGTQTMELKLEIEIKEEEGK